MIFGVDQDQRLTKKIATMALDQSALTDLLDAPRLDEDLDFIWDAMQLVMQALIDLEATQVIGAARYGLVLGSVSPGAK